MPERIVSPANAPRPALPASQHGGRLRAAVRQYGIALTDWLDLSTGINPQGWPVPPLPPACWQRLPEEDDGLEAAAAAYYGSERLLPVPGSQAAIQLLPHLFPAAEVACIAPLYSEHPQAWAKAGHRVRYFQHAPLARAVDTTAPVVLLCNPNNPTATRHARTALLAAAAELKARGGWLVVDEAFADPAPEDSVADLAGGPQAPNLIVLRSLGKFFGLAGARVGFVFATPDLFARLAEAIGPWAVAGPSREVARLALGDVAWQTEARQRLAADSERLRQWLARLGEVAATPLFVALKTEHGEALHDFLARRGILIRRFDNQPLVRFGLPGGTADWRRLAAALAEWKPPC